MSFFQYPTKLTQVRSVLYKLPYYLLPDLFDDRTIQQPLVSQFPQGFESIVNRFTEFDSANEYFVITHLLELHAAEMRLVVEAAIEKTKGRADIISEVDERKLRSMVVPLLERSIKLAETGKFIDAVEPVLVIFTIIENEMDHVKDEGFELQLLVGDCFETLKKIADYDYGTEIARQFKKLCFEYNKQRDEELSFYDDEWAEVSDALCRLWRFMVYKYDSCGS
jgi:hypothetical protein